MKGVYSSPDSVNGRVTQTALFPDNTYAEDSGGDPEAIPNLTFQEFKVRRRGTAGGGGGAAGTAAGTADSLKLVGWLAGWLA